MSPSLRELFATGEEVLDAEEEAFLLFSQDIPTANLGFVDSRATEVEVAIRDVEYTIHQSPTLLASSRAGGTTGAVVASPGALRPIRSRPNMIQSCGKSPPLFAQWISSPSNPLWKHSLLSSDSTVAELGCGISALVALTLAPSVQHYIATDQEYVRRLFRTNLEANTSAPASASKPKSKSKSKVKASAPSALNITFTTLDWELDQPGLLKSCIEGSQSTSEDLGFDLLISCDCIYNEALVPPFVRTCAELCRLRPVYHDTQADGAGAQPTICVVAQQQRSPEVFETWLRETLRYFRVWRLNDEVLGDELKGGTGYLVHLLLVK
ncbi:hypothetical protein N7468_006005 [Penicillium chermesinum]|uniref:Diaminohydroxyphosphoribosylamino-pyrimidine deaminase n=1 Tax=Penicillium chermesinum TaxID=63820 RepID=A0A9W9TQ83_9EURO|nr:uncharacterized protein N7468_006005 [Penicillium chermesinum]KAJ5233049.1 hypothetical protein N7468_006005 [Penicillium chermesinum]